MVHFHGHILVSLNRSLFHLHKSQGDKDPEKGSEPIRIAFSFRIKNLESKGLYG